MHYGVDLGNMEALWKRALHESWTAAAAHVAATMKKSEHSGTVILKRKRSIAQTNIPGRSLQP